MTDNRLYPATRAGLQAKATQEWLNHREEVKAKITRLLDVLTSPEPVVMPESGFAQFEGFWVKRGPMGTNAFDLILSAAAFANEVGQTVYIACGGDRWLVIPTFGDDVSLWDAYLSMSETARNEESRARGVRDTIYTVPSELPFDAWQAIYSLSRPDVREAMLRDRDRVHGSV